MPVMNVSAPVPVSPRKNVELDSVTPLPVRPRGARRAANLFRPGVLLWLLGLLVGGAYCIFIPYGAGFDEETHLVRMADISYLHLLPNRSKNATATFGEFFQLSYQRRYFTDPATDQFAPQNFLRKFDSKNRIRVQTRSIYSPVIFLPQSFVLAVFWRLLDLPVLPVVILARMTGLLLYLAAVWLALRWLPLGKWVFVTLALSPMALFQAATLNADGFTNAVSFLLIGLTLAIALQEDKVNQPWQVLLLGGFALLLGCAKPGAVALLPLVLLLWPRRGTLRRFSARWMLVLLFAAVLVGVMINVGWTAFAVPNSHFAENGAQDVHHQLQVVLAHPVDFVTSFVVRTLSALPRYFRDWTGVYGYWVGEVPTPVYGLYLLALLAAIAADSGNRVLLGRTRVFLLGVFVLAAGVIAAMYYYLHYIPGDMSGLGKQGRYYIPMAPLFFLAWVGIIPVTVGVRRLGRWLAAVALLASLAFYSLGMYATYYTECGWSAFVGRSCTLPVYKNLDIYAPPVVDVNQHTLVTQSFISHCGRVESAGVLISALPQSLQGSLRFSVTDGQAHVLAAQYFPAAQLSIGQFVWLSLPLAAQNSSDQYVIRLEAPDVLAPDSIGVGLREGQHYRDGVLLLDGKPVGSDAIFLYRCPNR